MMPMRPYFPLCVSKGRRGNHERRTGGTAREHGEEGG